MIRKIGYVLAVLLAIEVFGCAWALGSRESCVGIALTDGR